MCTLCLSILSQSMKLKTIAVPYGEREVSRGTVPDGMIESVSSKHGRQAFDEVKLENGIQ